MGADAWLSVCRDRRKGYFRLKRKPKFLERGDRVYICYEGRVDHYYDFKHYDKDSRRESGYSDFFLDFASYHKLKRAVRMKGFRGFRYVRPGTRIAQRIIACQ